MIEQWADWVPTTGVGYQNVDLEWHTDPEFTQDEQAAIVHFHKVWNEVAEKVSQHEDRVGGFCGIADLIEQPFWQTLMAEAARALQVFGKRGELLDFTAPDEV